MDVMVRTSCMFGMTLCTVVHESDKRHLLSGKAKFMDMT